MGTLIVKGLISNRIFINPSLHEKCPYSELFWSAFSRIPTEYWEILRIQSECGKMQTRITSNTDTFHTVLISWCFKYYWWRASILEYLILDQSNLVLLHSVNILTQNLFHYFFLYTLYHSFSDLYSIVHADLLIKSPFLEYYFLLYS